MSHFILNQNTFADARLHCVAASPQRVLQLLSLSKTSKNLLSILIIWDIVKTDGSVAKHFSST